MKLSYNSAPELVFRWLDGSAEFSDEQAVRVRADIERLHQWHRSEELPRYAALLEGAARQAPSDLTPDAACAIFDEVRERLDALFVRAEPAIAAIAVDFSPAQFSALERKFAKVNAKYRKEWLDSAPGQVADKRLERAARRAERLYGHLEEPQLTVLREQLAEANFDAERSFAQMQQRQRDTIVTLERLSASDAPAAELRAAVHAWAGRMQRSSDPRYRARQDETARQTCVNVAGLHNSTTPAQRAHAAERLLGYAQDLRELAD